MLRALFTLGIIALATTPAFAQTGTTTPQTQPPSSSPNTLPSQSPTGAPSPFVTPQPFGTTSPIDPTTGLPTNLSRPGTTTTSPGSSIGVSPGLPSASPSFGSSPATALPPPVWSPPSPPAGQPLTPGSR